MRRIENVAVERVLRQLYGVDNVRKSGSEYAFEAYDEDMKIWFRYPSEMEVLKDGTWFNPAQLLVAPLELLMNIFPDETEFLLRTRFACGRSKIIGEGEDVYVRFTPGIVHYDGSEGVNSILFVTHWNMQENVVIEHWGDLMKERFELIQEVRTVDERCMTGTCCWLLKWGYDARGLADILLFRPYYFLALSEFLFENSENMGVLACID